RLIESVRAGNPITLNVDAKPRMNPVYIDDVIRTVTAALGSEGHQLVNDAGDDAASILDLAESIGRAVARPPMFEEGEGRAGDMAGASGRLRTELGVSGLVPLDEGLRRTALAAVQATQAA